MMKRFLAILLCLCLALGTFTTPVAAAENPDYTANSFTDVKESEAQTDVMVDQKTY